VAFECQVDDLGYPDSAIVEIRHNGTSLVRQQSSRIQANLQLDASLKGTIVECRISHESFDLGLASPSWDELELVAPEISGANSVVELFLAEKKLTQVQAKYVNTDSALGSGTGVSVKIEKRLILRFILQNCEI
jgi:3-oxoacyl-(acyl-carrier-protein) synthase